MRTVANCILKRSDLREIDYLLRAMREMALPASVTNQVSRLQIETNRILCEVGILDVTPVRYEVAELDFTQTKPYGIREQGIVTCIRLGAKGWFALKWGRFASRQDLAVVTNSRFIEINEVKDE